MKGLTKENFWNEMYEQYPEAMKMFCTWIDEYKEEVGWDWVFSPSVKFHDVPLEMQVGIIVRFIDEVSGLKKEYERDFSVGRVKQSVRLFLSNLQNNLTDAS